MKSKQEILEQLDNHIGGTFVTSVPFTKFVATEGIIDLIELCECNWLIIDIALYMPEVLKKAAIKYQPTNIIFWKIKVKDKKAKLTAYYDVRQPVISYKYNYTNFPLDELDIWVMHDTIMLKSEY